MKETLLKFFKADLISKFSPKSNVEVVKIQSYCCLLFTFNNMNELKVVLYHSGDEKLEDVVVTVLDADNVPVDTLPDSPDFERLSGRYGEYYKEFHFDSIHPNSLYPVIPLAIDPEEDDLNFAVYIRFNSRILNQKTSIKNYKNSDRIVSNHIEEDGVIIKEPLVSKRQAEKL
jgi:hypothetical protein